MNKLTEILGKIIITLLGACNKVMSMFIPIAVALLLINMTGMEPNGFNAIALMAIAICSTLFRAFKEVLKITD